MELYKFNKTLYDNKISRGQLRDIYKNNLFNNNTLQRIKKSKNFDLKYDNNKIILATIMIIQKYYYDDISIAINYINNKNAPVEFMQQVVSQAKAYGIFLYYTTLNDDKIILPNIILQDILGVINNYHIMVNDEELDKLDLDSNAKKVIYFLLTNDKFTYLIYDIVENYSINSYIYQRLGLDFNDN
tara:strand:- start:556 stop:1113 length:558 start_codon:yes stop_codon:yes gene_type:complete